MFKPGEVYENPATGIRAVIQVGTGETDGEQLVVDLYARKCGAGSVLHLHPVIYERLTIVSGRVGLALNGVISIAEVGSTIEIPPGQAHRWWNAGIYEAQVRMAIQPAARFEDFMRNCIGLAQDGKTDPTGMPNLLQLTLLAREFNDVIRFLKPSRFVQRVVFPLLIPLARLLGYKGSYSAYLSRTPSAVTESSKTSPAPTANKPPDQRASRIAQPCREAPM
jgi:quercetin dioxygenase-like cupin family protein